MQLEAIDATDLSRESRATQSLYGIDGTNPAMAAYARRLLIERRLVEAGVRFVLVFAPVRDANWDHHGDVKGGLTKACAATDQPSGALVRDLHARGLLDSTILHQFGLDHRRLSFLHAGRLETLSDSEVTGAEVVRSLLI